MKLPTPLEAAARVDEGHAIASGLGLDEVAALLRSMARGSSDIEDTKLVYIKCWRTIVKLPAKYADEIVEALRAPAQARIDPVELRNNTIEACAKIAEKHSVGIAQNIRGLREALSLPSTSRATGPLVPWELDCKREVCAAPECDCPAVTSTDRGSATSDGTKR